MLIQTEIRYKGVFRTILKGKRAWNREIEEPSWRATGLFWKRNYLEKHFTEAGAVAYGYAPRKGDRRARGSKAWRRSFQGRKFARFGHTDPLVYTGEMRRRCRHPQIRATSTGVKVVLDARKANLRHPKSQVDMRKELRTITQGEAGKLTAEKARAMRVQINRVSPGAWTWKS